MPGTLIPAPEASPDILITAMHFAPEHNAERQITGLDAFLREVPSDGVLSLNITPPHGQLVRSRQKTWRENADFSDRL